MLVWGLGWGGPVGTRKGESKVRDFYSIYPFLFHNFTRVRLNPILSCFFMRKDWSNYKELFAVRLAIQFSEVLQVGVTFGTIASMMVR